MKLYFVNGSKQRKFMLETDYVDDIYDEIEAFFCEHHFEPHFLVTKRAENEWQIRFESQSEYFAIENVDDADEEEFRER